MHYLYKKKLRVRSRYEYPIVNKSNEYIKQLQSIAASNNDVEFLNRLEGKTSIMYHKICRLRYAQTEKKKLDQSFHNETPWSATRDLHKQAFLEIEQYLLEEVVAKENVFYLLDIYKNYIALLTYLSADTAMANDNFYEYNSRENSNEAW